MVELTPKIYRIPLESDRVFPEIDKDGQGRYLVPLPVFSTVGASAMDFHSANTESIILYPGQTVMVPLGIKVAIPIGFKLTLKSRSGLASKNQVIVTNSPGTVDSDYRGEVKAILSNIGNKPFEVLPFSRICQGEVEESTGMGFFEVANEEELGATERGEGGFNSTGVQAITK